MKNGAKLHIEKDSENQYQSTNNTITEEETECESADSPMSGIDDEKSPSTVSEITSENIISQSKADQGLETVLPWDKLIPALQDVLPNQTNVTYVVTNYTSIPSCSFFGVPRYAFEGIV